MQKNLNNNFRYHMSWGQNLDKALEELGMLSAISEARREYLRETKTNLGVMRLDTRYVSNVTVGYCMKKAPNKNRPCPYVLPIRHRTKSENSDPAGPESADCGHDFKKNFLEPSTSSKERESLNKHSSKRCQSLENLNLSVESTNIPEVSPEMDCVSLQIQKLQVDE